MGHRPKGLEDIQHSGLVNVAMKMFSLIQDRVFTKQLGDY
jgi:hypothetical protein